MTQDRLTHAEMQTLCPGVTAKTELVLISNPAVGTEGIYARDGKHWVRLQGEEDVSAAQEAALPPDAAPLSGDGPDVGSRRGDDCPDGPTGPRVVYPQPTPPQTDATS